MRALARISTRILWLELHTFPESRAYAGLMVGSVALGADNWVGHATFATIGTSGRRQHWLGRHAFVVAKEGGWIMRSAVPFFAGS